MTEAVQPVPSPAFQEKDDNAMERETVTITIDVDDSPPIRSNSLLLCPAHWSALLEAAPVSLALVRRGGGSCEAVMEEGRVVRGSGGETPTSPSRWESPSENERTPQESECDNQDEMAVCEVVVESYCYETTEDQRLEEPPPSLSQRLKEHPSSLSLEGAPPPLSQQTSVEGDKELRISIEDDCPPSHGQPLSPQPSELRAAYQTHSRNVSETPSLPPFYSSSTSSAYHSRNSSLGSQLSSCCFDSDSMLTDMDSLLAVSSHGDLKQPIRLQDSRFRLGDSSPTSYSSDLSLHCHMTQPIGFQDRVLDIPRDPNLEETLRNVRDENGLNLEERWRMSSLKSSEWIKRQFEKDRESLVVVKVSSKTKHVVHFNVKAGDVIIWEFATKKKDIGFGVLFEATEVATEQMPLPSSHESLEKKMTAILPTFRVSAHSHPMVGYHYAQQDGVYEIIWDNTYSRFFAKELYYRITADLRTQ